MIKYSVEIISLSSLKRIAEGQGGVLDSIHEVEMRGPGLTRILKRLQNNAVEAQSLKQSANSHKTALNRGNVGSGWSWKCILLWKSRGSNNSQSSPLAVTLGRRKVFQTQHVTMVLLQWEGIERICFQTATA